MFQYKREDININKRKRLLNEIEIPKERKLVKCTFIKQNNRDKSSIVGPSNRC
ncbi:209_t:CDS:2 [Dentiscutata erythropus]|uniref:209_t:CDS:1 n=1 Tax=Dentiscutata erythropus TaxID=1348616 RepID=A0A9N8VCL0_9GLOM|nr:209_t:CDS:2 [Dentiscutata erythropus]